MTMISARPLNSLRRCAVWLAAALSLSACVNDSPYASNGAPQPWFTAQEAASITQATSSATEGQKFLSGTTALSISGAYGTQIEYLAPDGSSDLWFPGSSGTTPGRWKVVESGSGEPVMCFLYGANSYDPVQKTYGGAWECGPLKRYIMRLGSLAVGDPFRLANGKVPFMMPPGAFMVLAQAQEKAGRSASQAPLQYRFNRFKVPQTISQ
jgi:hypothetical protein